MIVREKDGAFALLSGNPTLTSLDGEQRAPLRAILTLDAAEQERFGVCDAEPMQIPSGKRAKGPQTFERGGDGKVREVRDLEDVPASPVLTNAQKLEAATGLTVAEIKAVLSVPGQGAAK